MTDIRKLLESLRQQHHYCEDRWYSCPKHEEGCANEWAGTECNCGADEHNARIDKALSEDWVVVPRDTFAYAQRSLQESINRMDETSYNLAIEGRLHYGPLEAIGLLAAAQEGDKP